MEEKKLEDFLPDKKSSYIKNLTIQITPLELNKNKS